VLDVLTVDLMLGVADKETSMELTKEILHEHLSYSKKTGDFTWIKKTSPKSRIRLGDIAGSHDGKGYLHTKLFGTLYRLHQLAYLYVEGYIPEEVHHTDEIRDNNVWNNLEEVDKNLHMKEHGSRITSKNKSGIIGVYWHKGEGKWAVNVRDNGKYYYFGYHEDIEYAALARYNAEEKHGYPHPKENTAYQFLLSKGWTEE